MRIAVLDAPPPMARWSSRIAVFAVALVATAAFLHRLFGMSTPVALNLLLVAFGCAVLALVLAISAAVKIWREGAPGTPRVVVGAVLSLGLIAAPLALLPLLRSLPELNDVTTDTASPPAFTALAKARPPGANPVSYPGVAAAKLQLDAFPDIRTLVVDRSAEETFEIVAESMRRQRMTLVAEVPPVGVGRPGFIEATDKTLIAGFIDDVVARVDGDGNRARIDLRSASRYGRHDLGRNAERLRRLLKEIVARLEATVPTATGERLVRLRSRMDRAMSRRLLKERDRGKAGLRTPEDRAQSGAQRGPGQKASPPSSGDRPGRDRPPARSGE
jgi:uncharacterized protein (DUF1499 family)